MIRFRESFRLGQYRGASSACSQQSTNLIEVFHSLGSGPGSREDRFMDYFLDIFTPETWRAFLESGANVTGFRERHGRLAKERVKKGDIFLCYLTRLSRWWCVLEAQSDCYYDDSEIFDTPDPFIVRFGVEPLVLLESETVVPIFEDNIWSALTITRQHDRRNPHWTGFFRSSLNRFDEDDGRFLVEFLGNQRSDPKSYPLTEKDRRHLARTTSVRTLDRVVDVEVPDDGADDAEVEATQVDHPRAIDVRESIQVQARVAQIGAEIGFYIWVPRNDRARVLEHLPIAMH